MHILGADVPQLLQVEVIQDIDDLHDHRALVPSAIGVELIPLVPGHQRLFPGPAVAGQVVIRKEPTLLLVKLDDRLCDFAFVEDVAGGFECLIPGLASREGPLLCVGEQAQRPSRVLLIEHVI